MSHFSSYTHIYMNETYQEHLVLFICNWARGERELRGFTEVLEIQMCIEPASAKLRSTYPLHCHSQPLIMYSNNWETWKTSETLGTLTERVKELISAEPTAALNYKGTVNIVIKMYSTGSNNSSVAQIRQYR